MSPKWDQESTERLLRETELRSIEATNIVTGVDTDAQHIMTFTKIFMNSGSQLSKL